MSRSLKTQDPVDSKLPDTLKDFSSRIHLVDLSFAQLPMFEKHRGHCLGFYMPLAYQAQDPTMQCFQQPSTSAKIMFHQSTTEFYIEEGWCNHHHRHHKRPFMLSSTPRCFSRLQAPTKGHYRCYLLHYTLLFFYRLVIPLTPLLLGLASVVVHFYLLPDRNGLTCEEWGVKPTQLCAITAVDDVHGRHVFLTQAGDGVNVIPICGCWRARCPNVSSLD